MALKADISVKIDTGGLVTTLTGQLTGFSADLDALALPANDSDLSAAGDIAGGIDLGSVAGNVGPLVEQLATVAGNIPGVDNFLQPITASLDLLEDVLGGNLETEIPALADRLAEVLEGGRDEGFVGVLVRFADALGGAPQTAVLRGLLDRLMSTAGVSLPGGTLDFPDIVPAFTNGIRGLGALMNLETMLAEAERLTGIMARQLDPAEIASLTEALEACVAGGGQSLADFVAGIDPTDAVELQTAIAAIDLCAGRLRALTDRVGEGMAFGEATLVHLDMPSLQAGVAAAAAMLREADLAPIERALGSLTDRIAPLLAVDVSALPSFSLDDLVTQVEGKVAETAAGITAFDLTDLTDPLATGIGAVTDLPSRLTGAIAEVTAAVQGALQSVRDAIAALPFDTIGQALRQAIEPVVDALEFIGELVEAIKAALQTAVDALKAVLGEIEGAVDAFQGDAKALFDEAADFIEGLNLDQVVGQVADNIKAFADAVAKAQMKPYFDTAVGAMDTATGVVEKVPFNLLPDSMEEEVVAAVRPIKQIDIGAVEQEIEDLLQIGPDGKFELRPDIEAALAGIQAKYDELIAEIEKFDLHAVVESVDAQLSALADKIAAISPKVELAPVHEAIEAVRGAISGFDLDALLAPLRDGFDAALAAIDDYSPGQLVAPIEARVDAARDRLLAATRLPEWAAALDELQQRGLELLNRLDPAIVEPQLQLAFDEALRTLDALPQVRISGGFGGIVTALLAGSGLRINPLAFDAVLDWLTGQSGASALTGRTARMSGLVKQTRLAVEAFDPTAVAARLGPNLAALQAAVAGHAAGPGKDALTAALGRLDANARLGGLAGNRTRYLALVVQADDITGILQRTGLSEVDIAVGRLRGSTAPLAPLTGLLSAIFERLGVSGLELGIPEAVRRLLEVAPAERLVGIIVPIFDAIRGRIEAILDAVITPLKDGIADLIALIEALDLTPLRESLDGIHQQVRAEIEQLHPDQLLGEAIGAFQAVQQQVAAFDPLTDIEEALTELRDAVTRILGKLDASALLERPLEVYDGLIDALKALDIATLLTPVLDQLDEIARQVDEGLDDTVGAFKRLQDALPSKIGSTTIAVSVSASVG